jgi:hypothetical protein
VEAIPAFDPLTRDQWSTLGAVLEKLIAPEQSGT